MVALFEPFELRDVRLRNRICVAPMCQYSAIDGVPNDWHLIHLASRAVGGAGLVVVEGTSVCPEGRLTKGDTGLWNDVQRDAFARIARAIEDAGAVAGIQLAHAGRKGATHLPWEGGKPLTIEEGRWPLVAPSALPFDEGHPVPAQADRAAMAAIAGHFRSAAKRAAEAGFRFLELHFAHGYLASSFLSPLSNRRLDGWGGGRHVDRARFPLEILGAVREVWPSGLPLSIKVSAVDWVDGGVAIEDTVRFAEWARAEGVDLVVCSSGGVVPYAKIPAGPGFQVPFAARVRADAAVATGAVGFLTEPVQAEQVLVNASADLVFLARESLRDPYWPFHAAASLGVDVAWPRQYRTAKVSR